MDLGPDDPLNEVASRMNATRSEFHAQVRRFEDVTARLQAQLDTMPVIEQAKGILMAQYRCPPEEAFDLLRRASQRANVKVNVLAAQIVEQIASPGPRPAGGPSLHTSGDRGGRTTLRHARRRA